MTAEDEILAEDTKAIRDAITSVQRDLEDAQRDMRESDELEWVPVHPRLLARILAKARDAIHLEELYDFETPPDD